MTTLPAAERHGLAQSVRAACARLAPEERVRAVAFDYHGNQRGFDREFWKVLCNQVGVAAIALPEHVGGAGCGMAEIGVVAHELGRVLAPVPFVASTVLASGLLADAGADATAFAQLSGGERTAAAALTSDGGIWDLASVTLSARRATGSGLLTGRSATSWAAVPPTFSS